MADTSLSGGGLYCGSCSEIETAGPSSSGAAFSVAGSSSLVHSEVTIVDTGEMNRLVERVRKTKVLEAGTSVEVRDL